MKASSTYNHTQVGKLHWLIVALALAVVGMAIAVARQLGPMWVTGAVVLAAFGLFIAYGFRDLTIRDDGERLGVHFGPLPLFSTFFDYDQITWVAVGRTSIIDGWGIHYVPLRGWTYNVWGRDCVVLYLSNRIVRLGTDDAEGLYQFLKQRLGQKEAG